MEATPPQVDNDDPTPDSPLGEDETPAAGTPSGNIDGRSLRRERNREAVIVSLLELIREGNHDPATSDIADRAGVSHRSVFRYFEDLNDLVRQAIEYEIADAIPLATMADMGEGPVEARIESLIESRLRVYEHTHPVARVARARSLSIPAIDEGMGTITNLFRGQLAAHFAPELAEVDVVSGQQILDAIQALTNFETYDYLRRRLGRDDAAIIRIWRTALVALLTR